VSWPMPVIAATLEVEVGGSWSKASLGKVSETLFEKQTKSKRAGGVSQVIQHLPNR
jgi:hypothetical protein